MPKNVGLYNDVNTFSQRNFREHLQNYNYQMRCTFHCRTVRWTLEQQQQQLLLLLMLLSETRIFRCTEQHVGGYRNKWSMTSQTGSELRSRGRGSGGNKRTICLWQFLRELLLNPQMHHNWIRWIDRNKGNSSNSNSTLVVVLSSVVVVYQRCT